MLRLSPRRVTRSIVAVACITATVLAVVAAVSVSATSAAHHQDGNPDVDPRLLDSTASAAFFGGNAGDLLRTIDASYGPVDGTTPSSSNLHHQQQSPIESATEMTRGGGDFCFVSHGCWGGSDFGQVTHRRIASLIARTVKERGASFVIAAGDNFYTKGIKSVDDSRFRDTFTNVYVTPFPHMKSVPFVTALGNHDYRGNFLAQVNMTQRDPNWFMPHPYYAVVLSRVSLAVVVLDCPLLERCAVNPSGSKRCWDGERQMPFLEAALRSARDRGIRHRVVTCHYPLYANGPHINHAWLRALLDPVMVRYGVALYINADNHYIQVSNRRRAAPNLYYVNSGGGGGYRLHTRSVKGYRADPSSVFEHIGDGVFLHCVTPVAAAAAAAHAEASRGGTELRTTALADDGRELFSFASHEAPVGGASSSSSAAAAAAAAPGRDDAIDIRKIARSEMRPDEREYLVGGGKRRRRGDATAERRGGGGGSTAPQSASSSAPPSEALEADMVLVAAMLIGFAVAGCAIGRRRQQQRAAPAK